MHKVHGMFFVVITCVIHILNWISIDHTVLKSSKRYRSDLPYYTSNVTSEEDVSFAKQKSRHGLDSNYCSMENRLNHVKTMCQQMGLPGNVTNQPKQRVSVFISEEHQLIFCPIPKCASTTFLRFLGASTMSGRKAGFWDRPSFDGWEARGLQRRALYPHELNAIPYTKLMVVRHPLHRLLSAFYDKMGKNSSRQNPVFEKMRRRIKEMYKISEEESNHMDPPFEFWQFATHTFGLFRNPHWNSFAMTCNPCAVHYNHILRLETFATDIQHILKLVNATVEQFEMHTANRRSASSIASTIQITTDETGSTLLPEFSKVSNKTRRKLHDKYANDLKLFGYGFDFESSRTWCRFTANMSSNECC